DRLPHPHDESRGSSIPQSGMSLLRGLSGLALALALVSPAFSANGSPNSCSIAFQRFVAHRPEKLPAFASFEEIKSTYQAILARKGRVIAPEIDAQRLINEADWAKATEAEKPWKHYGTKTMRDWMMALRFIKRD